MNTEINLLPFPEKIEPRPGRFRLDGLTRITPASDETAAALLRGLFGPASGVSLPPGEAATNVIALRRNPDLAALGAEGCRLEVTPERVTLEAFAPAGLFYGVQTLRSLLPAAAEARQSAAAAWEIPCLSMTDRPRFPWRGFMLDEGRHFHGQETVLQMLDWMALLKLNVFHWHLTEDQGWRIEIKKYPRLAEVGARRPGTKQSMWAREHNGIPHAGCYTQEEIRAIVAYAAARHITVVPEIELPGHSRAALAAYPELACRGGPFEVATGFGVFPDILCAGKEETLTFLQEVLAEVIALFPSPYLHIGGDEAPKARWKACPHCQERMRREGLPDEHALQVWLTGRVAGWLDERRRIVGWNEILRPGLHPTAIAQYWVGGRKELRRAMREDQRQVVMSPFLDAYLDHGYNLTPLRRAYAYDPAPEELTPAEARCILGPEFPLWTEWVPDRRRLDYQVWPRLCALAEVGWTPRAQKNYASFLRRLEPFLARLEQRGVGYAPRSEWDPPFWKRLAAPFTILLPQRRVAPSRAEKEDRKTR